MHDGILELSLLEIEDNRIGAAMLIQAGPELLLRMEELLLQMEKDLNFRDQEILKRDQEILKNIRITEHLYSSYRYRIGRFIIRPFEILAIKTGLAPKPTSMISNFNSSHSKD